MRKSERYGGAYTRADGVRVGARFDVEEYLELVELAEEAALAELHVFGNVEHERGMCYQTPEENAALWGVFVECDEYQPFELY